MREVLDGTRVGEVPLSAFFPHPMRDTAVPKAAKGPEIYFPVSVCRIIRERFP